MAAFGGGQYSGPDPAAYAAGKGMAASHIDMLAGHVASAMTELGMPPVSFRGYVPPVSCAASQDEWGNAIVKSVDGMSALGCSLAGVHRGGGSRDCGGPQAGGAALNSECCLVARWVGRVAAYGCKQQGQAGSALERGDGAGRREGGRGLCRPQRWLGSAQNAYMRCGQRKAGCASAA